MCSRTWEKMIVHLTIPVHGTKTLIFFSLFSALCAVLLLFCLIGTILDAIIEAYNTSEENTSPSDQNNTVELQSVTTPPQANNTLTRQTTSSTALHPPEETIRFGPPRFLKCKCPRGVHCCQKSVDGDVYNVQRH